MSELTDKYSKNFSKEKKQEFEKRVRDMLGNMSELSAIQLVLKEMREQMKDGGMIDKPLGSGGVKSGPPPKSGPNPQGLKIPLKQVKQ
tara:strand:- start:304 stop:567 length:264 start_codon:yes stop_codon:yes gene_type:complete